MTLSVSLPAACGGAGSPAAPSPGGVRRFADITPADALRYVRPAALITRPDVAGMSPRFVFETSHSPCPLQCEAEVWDGTMSTCTSVSHVPADSVTLYVIDPARAHVQGRTHAAYASDSIYFRGRLLPTGPCALTEIPATCAVLSINDTF
jgi:hypothetical protein